MARREALDPVDKYNPRETLITSINARFAKGQIELPRKVSGLTIVDIASGGSNRVALLRGRGANAFGVDIAYSNLKRLRAKVAYGIEYPNWWRAGEKVPKLREDQVDKLLSHKRGDSPTQTLDKEAFATFEQTLKEDPPYIAADAEELPFATGSVDFVYSIFGITSILISDSDAFNAAVLEAVRILKPGGEFQAYPWISPTMGPSHTPNQIKNIKTFLDLMKKMGIQPQIDKVRWYGGETRLKIVKPK